jgi:hypothetical protein
MNLFKDLLNNKFASHFMVHCLFYEITGAGKKIFCSNPFNEEAFQIPSHGFPLDHVNVPVPRWVDR